MSGKDDCDAARGKSFLNEVGLKENCGPEECLLGSSFCSFFRLPRSISCSCSCSESSSSGLGSSLRVGRLGERGPGEDGFVASFEFALLPMPLTRLRDRRRSFLIW